MMPEKTAADLLVEELRARGVSFIATLNGHGLEPFYLACRRAQMRMIDVRNEQAASYMAEVAGRLSRSVGICAVSGAVAHANALTGVLNAAFDGAPMMLVTGMAPLKDLGWGNFQDFNPVPMAAPICKYARLVDVPERVGHFVHEAFSAATDGRPGPVHLSLPADVASAEVSAAQAIQSGLRRGQVHIRGAGDPGAIEDAAQLIQRASRPVLVAGSGVYYSRGEEALADFSAKTQIPIVVPIWDRGSIPGPMPQFVGVVGAASGGARILPEADLVIAAGTDFDYRIGQLRPPVIDPAAKTVRIHADGEQLSRGLAADVTIHASPATALCQLTDSIKDTAARDWMVEASRRRDQHRNGCLNARLPGPINGRDVVLAVREVTTEQTILLVDGGNVGQWHHQLILDRYPGNWVTCGASGVVGWGLPGALAARALYPDRNILLLSGDGSFTFTVAELECAARQKLPFVAVVADDEEWGISVTGQIDRYGHELYSKLGPTRLDKVAEGFGCRGLRVESKDALVHAIKDGFSADCPTVIQVPIAPSSPAM